MRFFFKIQSNPNSIALSCSLCSLCSHVSGGSGKIMTGSRCGGGWRGGATITADDEDGTSGILIADVCSCCCGNESIIRGITSSLDEELEDDADVNSS